MVVAAEGIEGHAAKGLGDGVAADDLAGRIYHRVLRQVEARERSDSVFPVAGSTGAFDSGML